MITIGESVQLDNPFILAPMAGIGDPPFRRLCRQGGAGLVCAEMVSSNALHFNDKRSARMLQTYEDEHPVSMQIFGNDPDRLASAAKKVEAAGADIVDLNCGCPVPKITQSGAGMTLMKDEKRFEACISAMRRAVKIPVTVKMRLGFQRQENRASHFARIAQNAGADAVSVHARAMTDRHDGPPSLELLQEVVESVSIPVFGNGGVETYEDAKRMMSSTGCVGVLIGQAAVGNPLLFLELLGAMAMDQSHMTTPKKPGFKGMDRFAIMRRHAELITDYYGEDLGVRRFRKYLPAYVKGLRRATEFRAKACTIKTLNHLLDFIHAFDIFIKGHSAPFDAAL